MLMDGFPGIIVSDDDFAINAAGLMVPKPRSPDTVSSIPMAFRSLCAAARRCNMPTQSMASLRSCSMAITADMPMTGCWPTTTRARWRASRSGLKLHRVWRTKDGYFVGANFPSDPKLIKEETDFDPNNMSSSPNARHKRWEEVMPPSKGQIDVALGEKFLADHWDTYENKDDRNFRGLCGHGDASPTPEPAWGEPGVLSHGRGNFPGGRQHHGPKNMTLQARAGHPCGEDFIADTFLKEHPEFGWQQPVLARHERQSLDRVQGV